MKESVQNKWSMCFKSVKVMKDRKTEELGTIIEWRKRIAMWDPGWILSQKKNISKKNKKNKTKQKKNCYYSILNVRFYQ